MPEDVRKDLDMDGVARRDFMIASATAVGTSTALALGASPASAQGGATPTAASPARATYTGEDDGKRVVTALDVNDLEPGRKHLQYFRGVATPTGQHWHVSVTVARGTRPGKRLILVSGVHGDEMSSIHGIHPVTATFWSGAGGSSDLIDARRSVVKNGGGLGHGDHQRRRASPAMAGGGQAADRGGGSTPGRMLRRGGAPA